MQNEFFKWRWRDNSNAPTEVQLIRVPRWLIVSCSNSVFFRKENVQWTLTADQMKKRRSIVSLFFERKDRSIRNERGKERCGDGGNRPIRIWARLVDVVSVKKTWFVWATCTAVRDFSWPQHSFPIPRKQSEISMVIDLPELNDLFHFSQPFRKNNR